MHDKKRKHCTRLRILFPPTGSFGELISSFSVRGQLVAFGTSPLVTSTFAASRIDRKPVSPQAEAKEEELNAALDAAKAGILASAFIVCRVVP